MCIDTCEKLSCHLYILNMTTQNPLIHVQTTTTTPTTTSVHSPMQVVSSPPQQLHVVSGTRTLQVLDVLLFQNVFVFFRSDFPRVGDCDFERGVCAQRRGAQENVGYC